MRKFTVSVHRSEECALNIKNLDITFLFFFVYILIFFPERKS